VIEPLTVRRRRLVRDELGSVAVALFAEHGFEAVTVDDIAATAGISPRTFFRYFQTKEEVILDYERRLQHRLIDALRNRPSDEGAVRALREAYLATAHVAPHDRDSVLKIGRILKSGSALRAQADGLRMGADDNDLIDEVARRLGTKRSDLRARVIVTAISAVAVAEFRAWVDDGRGDLAKRMAEALRLVEDGLSTMTVLPKGGRKAQ
jgi:AcrR family transcriptional regulator